MRLRLRFAAVLVTLLVSLAGWAQESSVVRVGVAVLENDAGRSVPASVAQAQLVKSINRIKPDKKTHVTVEAIALNGSTAAEQGQEAIDKHCEYVVYTRLTELRGQQDPYQRQPGTIETSPNSQWGSHNQAMDPEYRGTIEYRMVSKGGSTVAGAPFSSQQAGNEMNVVSQILDRIALAVVDQARKGTPAMRE